MPAFARVTTAAHKLRHFAVVVCGASVFGCAAMALPPVYVANPQSMHLSPVVLFQDSTGPVSYHSPTVRDGDGGATAAPMTVTAESCQSGFQLPWAYSQRIFGSISAGWGDGGYIEALTRAQAKAPAHSLLYDVRADLRQTSILSIWRQLCVVVTASVAPGSAAPPARAPIVQETETKDETTHGQS